MVCKFYNGLRLCDDVRYKIRGVEVGKWLISDSASSNTIKFVDSDPGADRADWMIEHGNDGRFRIKHAHTGRYINQGVTFYCNPRYGSSCRPINFSLKASSDRSSCWLGIDIAQDVDEIYRNGLKYMTQIMVYKYIFGENSGTAILNKENDFLVNLARAAKQQDGKEHMNTMWRFIPSS